MDDLFEKLGLKPVHAGAGSGGSWRDSGGKEVDSLSPIDGQSLGVVRQATAEDCEWVTTRALQAFRQWRTVPAPQRGEAVRRMGLALRENKAWLARLVTLEVGKIYAEALGEVQEMIDMCDFAVGQSRMLYGLTMHSERPGHRMYEQWHPLGPVGVITAFNFPVAVWAWNAMNALIAGDSIVWKPSSKAPLSAIAVMNVLGKVMAEMDLPEGLLNVLIGPGETVGEALIADARIPLISATGSVPMGRHVARAVASRLGKVILELGGNNGVIVTPRADMELAVRAILFGAVGTAGQRCTTTRRVIVHRDVYKEFTERLQSAYRKVKIGHPLDEKTLMGPLIDRDAVRSMQNALEALRKEGGEVLYGGSVLTGGLYDAGTYVTPAICRAKKRSAIVKEETFAPILYLQLYEELEEAISLHNDVPQGLTSAIFTSDLREAEHFLSHAGSDCGIANVNIGTSGAEIGGAFGGEKETGGGREAGSDAWKAYMRRQTNTINWSRELPLAQGIRFDVDDA